MGLEIRALELIRALREIGDVTILQIEAAAPELALRMEAYAKANAPWTDRTGNARRTLEGFSVSQINDTVIGVCGNMPYSPQLEIGHGGKYAILVPTVDAFAPEAVNILRNAIIQTGGLGLE